METIVCDFNARTKKFLLDRINHYLYTPLEKDWEKRLNTLILKNTVQLRAGHQHFVYKGQLYQNDPSPRPIIMNRLCSEYRPLLEELLAEKERVGFEEKPLIQGFLIAALNLSDDQNDWLLMLPDCLHPPVNHFQINYYSYPNPLRLASPAEITALQTKHANAIDLIRMRLATNLLY